MRSMMVVGLVLCAVVASGGCCAWCNPCAQGVFDCGPCDGGACGPPCGGCGPCDGGCGAPCCGVGPVRWVLGVLGFRCGGGCSTGCGEPYCGDWCSSPPDGCEPCDQCGNYVGQQGSYAGPGAYANQAYAGQPRQARPIASAPKRIAPTGRAEQVVGKPKILSETDEVVQPATSPADWQARAQRSAAASR